MIKVLTAFGLNDVAIATPTTGGSAPTWIDVPAVTAAAFKQTVQEVEQVGDDVYIGTFRYNQKGMITVKGTKASMRVFEVLSGNTASSLAGGGSMIEFGTDAELIPPRIAVRSKITVKNEDGTRGTATAYWYSCDTSAAFSGFPDGQYGKIAEVQFDLMVYKSTTNEKGEPVLGTSVLGRVEFPA